MTIFNPKRPVEHFFSLPEGRAVILAIGKFVKAKGHEHVVAMARIIEAKNPGKCHYVIIGDAIPGQETYKTFVAGLIRTANLDAAFTIIPHIPHEHIPSLFARTTVFVHLPNWQEGLGGAVLEAMAMNVPVVAFDSGGVAECFTSGLSGFLVPSGNIQATADAVIRLISDSELRNTIGAHARNELLVKFSYEKHFCGIEEIYKQTIQ
jgi:glycosyltransferase involved in cell wall biosynthesis